MTLGSHGGTTKTLLDHAAFMRLAIQEAELARGSTGDNPWVGCVIVAPDGTVIARGHTQGPGEDHAEIQALRSLAGDVHDATLYSTLEPCSFHGRTPACSQVIVQRRPALVVTAMRDPHPRVDGAGVKILRDAGLDVLEGVEEDAVRRQLGTWVISHHPHEPLRRARALLGQHAPDELAAILARLYEIPNAEAARLAELGATSP